MNKFIIPLLTFCVISTAQSNAQAMDGLVKEDTSTGSPSNKEQVPESAKDELLRLLRQPFNPEQDQESIKLRIQQLREHLAKNESGIPPKIPPRQVSNQDVIQTGNSGLGVPDVDTELLVNLALERQRLNPGKNPDQIRGDMSPSEIERAARAITDLEDPNMSTDGIDVKD